MYVHGLNFANIGVCRKWHESSITQCHRAFPQNADIFAAIVEDLNSTAKANQRMDIGQLTPFDTKSRQALWKSLTKASSALLIASIVWTLGVAIIIQIDRLAFAWFAFLIGVGILIVFGAAGIYTAVLVDQTYKFHSLLAPAPKLSSAIALGPGFYILWVFALCTLIITPGMAFAVLAAFVIVAAFVLVLIWVIFEALQTHNVREREEQEERRIMW